VVLFVCFGDSAAFTWSSDSCRYQGKTMACKLIFDPNVYVVGSCLVHLWLTCAGGRVDWPQFGYVSALDDELVSSALGG
jgi:hypothetical protein